MSFEIETIPLFDRQAKRLAKKYPSLKNDLSRLIATLTNTPDHGTALGNGFYKIRLAISSKGKGKSGGARVITYLRVARNKVFLISIFDKSAKDSVTDQELKQIFKMLPE